MFALRLDDRSGYREMFYDLFKSERFKKVIGVKHKGKTGENIHYHFALECDYKQQALRVQLKKLFNLGKGNGHMSLKVWDGKKNAIAYMFHEEGYEIVINNGYSDKYLKECQEINERIQEDVKKCSPNNICHQVIERMGTKQDIRNTRLICYTIWDILNENGNWFPNKYQLERWISMVQSLITHSGENPEQQWKNLKDKWYEDLFHH